MNWFWLILASAVCLGFYDVCKKDAVRDNSVMPVLFWATMSGTIFFLLYSLLSGNFVPFATGFDGTWQWFLLLFKALLVGASWICVYYAMRELPISIVSPIRATSPLWTFAGSILIFSEIPTWPQGVGMLVIFIGYYLFSVIGKLEGISFVRHKGIHLVLLGTFLGAASALYDKYLLGILQIPRNTVQFWFCVDLIAVLGIGLLIRKCFAPGRPFIWKWSIPATGTLLILSDYLYFYSLSLPNSQIAILSLIRRSSCIITFLVGFYFFKDLNFKTKFAALLLILLGVTILGLSK